VWRYHVGGFRIIAGQGGKGNLELVPFRFVCGQRLFQAEEGCFQSA
jgi:hypothetical protein